jgi:glycosyltransferase involved in cell wall biosynthesis
LKTIAHVLPFPAIGGTEHATLRIAAAVDRSLFRHVAFCLPHAVTVRAFFENAGLPVIGYEPSPPSYRHSVGFVRSSWILAREFKRRKVDLVHCSDLLAAYYAALAGRLAGIPVICHVRARFDIVSKRDCSFLWPVNSFIFVSNNTREFFGCRRYRSKGVVVYDGIDVPLQRESADDRAAVRREFGISADAPVIGMIARIAPVKDFATLARAAARILKAQPNVRFLIVGDYTSIDAREHYAQVRRDLVEHGVDRAFVFAGHRQDISRMLASLDIFVLSTHLEGLPLVILEAMAYGTPVIATAVGGVPELVNHGDTGLLHRHGDDAELSAHVLTLLQDRGLARQLADNALQTVRTRFARDRFADDMNAVYKRTLRL